MRSALWKTCPCGHGGRHILAMHRAWHVVLWHPVFGSYAADDPVAEHRDGEHDDYPDPDSCPVCKSEH